MNIKNLKNKTLSLSLVAMLMAIGLRAQASESIDFSQLPDEFKSHEFLSELAVLNEQVTGVSTETGSTLTAAQLVTLVESIPVTDLPQSPIIMASNLVLDGKAALSAGHVNDIEIAELMNVASNHTAGAQGSSAASHGSSAPTDTGGFGISGVLGAGGLVLGGVALSKASDNDKAIDELNKELLATEAKLKAKNAAQDKALTESINDQAVANANLYSDIGDNAADITTNAGAITTNEGAISTNTDAIGDLNNGLVKDVYDNATGVKANEDALDVVKADATTVGSIKKAVQDLEDGQVKLNKDALDVVKGGDATEGSIKKAVQDLEDGQVADNTGHIGDATSGLLKDVDDNAAASAANAVEIGDATSGLVKDVAQNAADIAAIEDSYTVSAIKWQAYSSDPDSDSTFEKTPAVAAVAEVKYTFADIDSELVLKYGEDRDAVADVTGYTDWAAMTDAVKGLSIGDGHVLAYLDQLRGEMLDLGPNNQQDLDFEGRMAPFVSNPLGGTFVLKVIEAKEDGTALDSMYDLAQILEAVKSSAAELWTRMDDELTDLQYSVLDPDTMEWTAKTPLTFGPLMELYETQGGNTGLDIVKVASVDAVEATYFTNAEVVHMDSDEVLKLFEQDGEEFEGKDAYTLKQEGSTYMTDIDGQYNFYGSMLASQDTQVMDWVGFVQYLSNTEQTTEVHQQVETFKGTFGWEGPLDTEAQVITVWNASGLVQEGSNDYDQLHDDYLISLIG